MRELRRRPRVYVGCQFMVGGTRTAAGVRAVADHWRQRAPHRAKLLFGSAIGNTHVDVYDRQLRVDMRHEQRGWHGLFWLE